MNALPGKITLTVLSGPEKGRHKTFEQDVIVLGREAECDLALTRDDAVSSKHALLVRDADSWTIEDLRSKNGLYVEVLSEKNRVDKVGVSHGQVLLLGQSRIGVDLSGERNDAVIEAAAGQPTSQPDRNRQDGITLLRITAVGERLKFQMITEGAVGTQHTLAIASSDIQEVVARFHDIVLASTRAAAVSPQRPKEATAAALYALGDFLSVHFIPARVRAKLCNAKPTQLFLLLDPHVVHLPWELAVLDNLPLCLKFSVGRQVVVDDSPTIQPRVAGSRPPRLLIVSTPTEDLPEAYVQAQNLFRWLRSVLPSFHLDFMAGARAERIPLLTRMDGSEIVYFIGHAESDGQNPMNSGWLLKNGRVTCKDFIAMRRPPAFVFANGCRTCCESPQDGVPLSHDFAYGMASSSILSGVQSYLGAITDVDAGAAGLFAHSFFSHLLVRGDSTGESLRLARQELRDLLGSESLAWSAYVLYGNPSWRFV